MNRAATSPQQIESRGKLMAALFTAQVCGSTGHSIGMAVGSIMAAGITGTNTGSGLPGAIGALGSALASWPLARPIDRSGRRPGPVPGHPLPLRRARVGMVGGLVQSLPLLLVGMALFGIAQTSNLLSRYAAADVSPGSQRGRAMGLIVWGSALGSLIGPNLMAPAVRAGAQIGVSRAASAFLISLVGYGLAAILIEIFLRPDPLAIARRLQESAEGGGAIGRARSLGAIPGALRVRLRLPTLAISQLVMICPTTPL